MSRSLRHIETIKLEGVCPEIFAVPGSGHSVEGSEVWRRNLTFRRGERYLVEAASGTGKSSLCAFLFGARRDFEGRILFDEEDTAHYSIEKWCDIRRDNIAYLPQEVGLFPEITVMENIMIKNRLTGYKSHTEIMEMLEIFGLTVKVHSPARLLSIGQQQRVAIIRALCQPFDFLLVDEPVSHLDAANNAIASKLIDHELKEREAGIIVTSVGNRLMLPGMTCLSL